MENARILNRIVLINIASNKYADMELSGNTCFVGTNNFGKTSLQRCILFFYSANSRGLGISHSQKSFEEHYFKFENSFIVYEVTTESDPFCIIIYRHNKINFRFIDTGYNADFFFDDENNAMKINEVLKKLDRNNVYYSNQIDTFERYRNILYGTETDKNLRKFFLLRGNEKYHNIPKSITDVFLSSKSSIDTRFIKDFIANSVTTEQTSIKLDQVERQLRQFNEKYTDIESFIRKDTQLIVQQIENKYDSVKKLKVEQQDLAEKLGQSLKYAEKQHDVLIETIRAKEEELLEIRQEYQSKVEEIEINQKDVRENIGYYAKTLRDAKNKLKEYEGKNIHEFLDKYKEKEKIESDLHVAKRQYDTLTSNVQSIELKYSSLLEQLQNEKNAFSNKINSRIAEYTGLLNEEQMVARNEFNKKENEARERKDNLLGTLTNDLTQKQIELNDLKSEERIIRGTRFNDVEINQLNQELLELQAITFKNRSDKSIKANNIDSLQREWESKEKQLNENLQLFMSKTNAEITNLRNEIKEIESKLDFQADAFYGYLEKNHKDWHNTLGKVLNEELLFRKDLKPELAKEITDSIYGVKIDLTAVPIVSKSIEEYTTEKISRLNRIKELELASADFQVKNTQEKVELADRFGRQIGEFKEESKILTYSLELADKREKKLQNELSDWKQKASLEIEEQLTENRRKQQQLDEDLSNLNTKKNAILDEFTQTVEKMRGNNSAKLKDLQDRLKKEISDLESIKEDKLAELEEKETQTAIEKDSAIKNKGVDAKGIKEIELRIKQYTQDLKEIDMLSGFINDYLKDKKDIFDKIPEYTDLKEGFEKKAKDLEESIKDDELKYEQRRVTLNKEKKQSDDEFVEISNGLRYFNNNFKDTPVFNKLSDIIEKAEPKKSNYPVSDLCTQLLKNESYFNAEFGDFQRHVNEFAGKFRLDNHFNFVIRNDATTNEFEKFAHNLTSFINEKRIDASIAETATQIGLVTDSIATKVKELGNQKEKIIKIIELISDDFKKAEFESSKLIEYIKVKIEESDNRVYKLLKKIEEFKEESGFMYGEGLFNTDFSSTSPNKEINNRAVKLLDSLRSAIKDENQTEIKLQDLFELKFKIKEGINETDWITRIDSIGSTGTDILVKAIIYITLLNVFIKESSHRASTSFKVHCIIDEVGQISAPYLKELLSFAKKRNINMINGLPNKSGLESHYRFTYQFRKEESGNIRIFPSIVTEVEA
jgi:nitrogen fixation protein FixH